MSAAADHEGLVDGRVQALVHGEEAAAGRGSGERVSDHRGLDVSGAHVLERLLHVLAVDDPRPEAVPQPGAPERLACGLPVGGVLRVGDGHAADVGDEFS